MQGKLYPHTVCQIILLNVVNAKMQGQEAAAFIPTQVHTCAGAG